MKRPGATLDAGCVIAKLHLDDPSRVQQVSLAYCHWLEIVTAWFCGCGSQPLVTPFPYVDLETRGFAVFLCFLVCILELSN